MTLTARSVAQVVPGQATMDGAGVRLRRTIGGNHLNLLDPFLLFDEFRSDDPDAYVAGFPEHPHRGFETVTYMVAGRMRHADSSGNKGVIEGGGAQWMTAGSGIIHSEMPEQSEGLLFGFQLWVNLPAAQKMTAPRYQDIAPALIPEASPADGVLVRVVAGRLGDTEGPVRDVVTQPLFLDVRMDADRAFSLPLPAGHNAFVYVYEGTGMIGPAEGGKNASIVRGTLAVLARDGDALVARSEGGPTRFLVVAGAPIGEPVARAGPFVMNTEEELAQAYEDYRTGRLVQR